MRRAILLAIAILVVSILLVITVWYSLDKRKEDLAYSVSVGEPVVTKREVDGTPSWDCRMDITRVEVETIYPARPVDADILWSDVRVQASSNGNTLILNAPLAAGNPASDTSFCAILIERAGGRSTIDVGDAIIFQSLDARFISAHVVLFYHHDIMCEFSLPSDFP